MAFSKLEGDHLVEKRNILTELRSNTMSLQELRFLSIYLAKINARDSSTRVVRFEISEFQHIMELGRLNIDHLQKATNSLLSKVINIPKDNGGYTGFTLFQQCTVDKDDNGVWYVEINANDNALPLLFDYK